MHAVKSQYLRVLKKSVENSGKMNGYGRMGDKNGWRYADG
jgi:hypothetical protein